MCGGRPTVDTTYQDWAMQEARRTRSEEEARQARIAEGMKAIQAVFEGGVAGQSRTPLQVLAETIRGTPGTPGTPDSVIRVPAAEGYRRNSQGDIVLRAGEVLPDLTPRAADGTPLRRNSRGDYILEPGQRMPDTTPRDTQGNPLRRNSRGDYILEPGQRPAANPTDGTRAGEQAFFDQVIRGQPGTAGTPDKTVWRVGGRTFDNEQDAIAFSLDNGTWSGGTQFAGIEPLLDQRETAMRDFFLPQLDDKREEAMKQLTFALSRAGLLTSSVAGEKQADLGDQYSLEKAGVLSKIAADRAGTKTALNQQRSSIEAALRSSGDVTAAANQALATTSGFEADQPELNPLGDVFYGIASGIGAAKQGAQVAAVRRSMTPNPLRAGAGRNVA